jgi:hypothetical protein
MFFKEKHNFSPLFNIRLFGFAEHLRPITFTVNLSPSLRLRTGSVFTYSSPIGGKLRTYILRCGFRAWWCLPPQKCLLLVIDHLPSVQYREFNGLRLMDKLFFLAILY